MKLLAFLETSLSNIAGAAVGFMAVSITVDVVARYVLRMPFIGIYALTQNYMLVAVGYFALSRAEKDGFHIRISILAKQLPKPVHRVVYCVANLLTVWYFSILTWKGWNLAWGAWQRHEISSGIIPWPLYIAYVLIPIGAAVIVLRLVCDCFVPRNSAHLSASG